MKILTSDDICKLLTIEDSIEILKHGYINFDGNKINNPERTLIHVENSGSVLGVMPIFDKSEMYFMVKIAAFIPQNYKRLGKTVNSLIILQNAENGQVEYILDGNTVTGLRTGGTSALITDHIVDHDVEKLTVIGSGVQAYYQLAAMLAIREFKEIYVYSRNFNNAVKLIRDVKFKTMNTTKLNAVNTIKEALANANVICTATTSTKPLFNLSDAPNIVHINMVGLNTRCTKEVSLDLIKKSFLIVENVKSAVNEAGKYYSNAVSIKDFLNNRPCPNKKITLFSSIGTAFQDLCLVKAIVKKSKSKEIGFSCKI